MSIRFRLMLSYIGMIIIPIVLIVSLSFIADTAYFKDKTDIINFGNPKHQMEKFFPRFTRISRNVNLNILENKDNLENMGYIKSLDKGLDEIYSGIIVKKNNKILYSSKLLENTFFLKKLPKFKSDYGIKNLVYLEDGYVILQQNDFYFNDGSKGSVFFVVNKNLIDKNIDQYRTVSLIVVIFIILLTSMILTYSIHRDMIKQLNKLKYASNEIKNGNLDYAIINDSKDEIGALSHDFEEMRMKLKESKDIQMKYEENRKNLLSNISHDLKTPIMAIKGYIEGIKDGVADTPKKMDKYINTIYKKAKDMEMLIDELFLFSKLDLKKVSFDFQRIDIVDYLKYCEEDLSFDLEKRNAKINLDYEKESIFVVADLQKLKRVIMNIIDNAMKYMDKENPNIHIKVRDQEEYIIVEIKDNGIGISKEDIPFIFDKFYRADKSRNTSINGSGLGLSICAQIIESHGGKMWAESKVDRGTSIFFTLKKWEGKNRDEENFNY